MDLQPAQHTKRTAGILGRWWHYGVDLVFPRNCPLCRRTLDADVKGCICSPCMAAFKRIEPPMCRGCGRPVRGAVHDEFVCSQCVGTRLHFDRAMSACLADARMLDAIHRFKYRRELFFAPHLAELLIEFGAKHVELSKIDLILPVPLHPRKERTRGFNQARILSRALCARFSKPLSDGNLCRTIDTPSQTFLNAERRRKNLHNAFAVRDPEAFRGKRLVLVDDVYTTGSTANVCARALKQAGATEVLVLTLARAD